MEQQKINQYIMLFLCGRLWTPFSKLVLIPLCKQWLYV